jgi:hypothetical protein
MKRESSLIVEYQKHFKIVLNTMITENIQK